MAPSRCFGTKRGGQQHRFQTSNPPAIHRVRRGLAYDWRSV
ncbi:MAG: hypothetical protein ABJK10_13780 [Rhodopirellula bahusiensis]